MDNINGSIYLPARRATSGRRTERPSTGRAWTWCVCYWASARGADVQDMPELPTPSTPYEAAKNGMDFFRELQNEDGHFAAEYGGELSDARDRSPRLNDRAAVLDSGAGHRHACYGSAVQRGGEDRVDPVPAEEASARGRLGSVSCRDTDSDHAHARHTAAPPTVYGTVMNYVTLRLLGLGPDEGPMTEIRALIHEMGGCGFSTPLVNRFRARTDSRRCYNDTQLGQSLAECAGLLRLGGAQPCPSGAVVRQPARTVQCRPTHDRLLPDWMPFAPWRWVRRSLNP